MDCRGKPGNDEAKEVGPALVLLPQVVEALVIPAARG